MNRRQLCAGVAGAICGLSGCLDALSSERFHLGGVSLVNRREEAVAGTLRIDPHGTDAREISFSLRSAGEDGSGRFVEHEGSDPVRRCAVSVEFESGGSDSFTYTSAESEGDCTIAYVGIRSSTVHFGSHAADDGSRCERASDG
ncbi:hypothetical protein [Halobellus rufus]|uniref:hypothetical protein n=1 Tax=Halobellus rufus TaxID=1448860 RepID=UPI000679A80D|nr:hypothetical protein [Halobellus rufus]